MASLLLSTSNHASFTSSIWGRLTSAPYDLRLVTEDGMIEAHCRVLFPLSPYHVAVETLPYTAEPIQVVLAGTSIKAVAAVKDLVYTGTCHLDELILPEILETLAVLGIEVSCNSFNFKTEATDDERSVSDHQSCEVQDFKVMTEAAIAYEESSDAQESMKCNLELADPLALGIEVSGNSFSFQTGITDDERSNSNPPSSENQDLGDVEEAATAHRADSDVHEGVREDLESAEEDDATKIKENSEEDVVEAFEGVTVGKAFHNVESSLSSSCKIHWQDVWKIKDVEVKISKLKMGEKLSLQPKEKIVACDFIDCKSTFAEKYSLERHIKSVHNGEKSYECSQCLKKFSDKSNMKKHTESVHNGEKPYECSQCLKKCSEKTNLRKHIELVHKKVRPYQCTQCLKKFGAKQKLTLHIQNVHNKEKPYVCPQPGCIELFGLKANLKRHMRKVHNIE